MKNRLRFLVLVSLPLVGCPNASCPTGQVAVQGACYPADAVAAVGGGVPHLCAGDCTGDTSHCDYHTGTCIGCRDASDCGDTAHPYCDASLHACVACETNDECSDPAAPRCEVATRACGGCESHDDCRGFSSTPSCDLATQTCVGCTSDTELSACHGYACDPAAHACTATLTHSLGPCRTCRTDSECGPGLRCVEFDGYQGAMHERVCLFEKPAGSACATSVYDPIVPYAHPLATNTVGGDAVTVCAPPTTCYATLAYVTEKRCNVNYDCTGDASTVWAGACIYDPNLGAKRCGMACGTTAGEWTACLFGDTCSFFCQYIMQ